MKHLSSSSLCLVWVLCNCYCGMSMQHIGVWAGKYNSMCFGAGVLKRERPNQSLPELACQKPIKNADRKRTKHLWHKSTL